MMDADTLLERQRLKSQLRRWRFGTVVFVVVALLASLDDRRSVLADKEYIARVNVTGLIDEDREFNAAVAGLAGDEQVKAVVVRIDSPGGTAVGGEALHETLQTLAEKKPVVATMGNMATSAAYLIALPAERIFARRGTITGSIGVMVQVPDFSGLAEKIGVNLQTVRTGPMKGEPSLFGTMSPAVKELMQGAVNDFYRVFVDLVAAGRKLPREKVVEMADGRIFTGQQAVGQGLVDEIGGEDAAVDWLLKNKKLAESLPVKDMEVEEDEPEWKELLKTSISGKWLMPESLSMYGLLSLWRNGAI